MKIVFVNRYYAPDHSATSQMLTDLATALAAAGRDIHVVASRLRYDDPLAALPAYERLDGVHVHRVWTTRFGRARLGARALDYASFYASATRALLALVRRGDVVVTKTDPPLISIPAGWAARRRRARTVNWLQDVFPEVAAALGVGASQRALMRTLVRARNRSLAAAHQNVVLGRTMHSRLADHDIASHRIAPIHNWADGSRLRPAKAGASALREAWNLGAAFVVAYSGNMGRAHEFDTLIDAMQDLAGDASIRFLLVGGGAHERRIDALLREGRARIVKKPYQPRETLAATLSVADVHLVSLVPALEGLVVPSKFYGIAAVARPTIFIGDAEGEIGTLVREARCGVVVAPGDSRGLAREIVRLRDDPERRRTMGDNARRLFERRFDFPHALARWNEVLEDATSASAR
jgi:glycosyltransferase involved in cell wall biosynthesis